MSGVLGIWNNANQKFLHDYEDWYNNEHLFERLSVSNINVGRRFQGLKSNYNGVASVTGNSLITAAVPKDFACLFHCHAGAQWHFGLFFPALLAEQS